MKTLKPKECLHIYLLMRRATGYKRRNPYPQIGKYQDINEEILIHN